MNYKLKCEKLVYINDCIRTINNDSFITIDTRINEINRLTALFSSELAELNKEQNKQPKEMQRVREQIPELKSLKTIEVCEQGVIVVMAIKGRNIIDVGRECITLSNYLPLAIDLHFNQSVIRIYKNTELKEIIQKSLEKM